jgi:DNA-binding response OmpR family regulator
MADKILVVDDESVIRELLRTFLIGEGYEVIEAASGEEAVETARREKPQVVLLDIKMPGMDGIEACERLRMDERTRFIPIIMVTAFGDSKMRALKAGADDFVNKPFEMVELAIRVKSILHIRHLTDELERAVAYIEELRKNLAKL